MLTWGLRFRVLFQQFPAIHFGHGINTLQIVNVTLDQNALKGANYQVPNNSMVHRKT
jgi:hypothetical protein